MIAQRVGVAALRRGAAKPNVFFNQTLPKIALTAGMSTTPGRNAAVNLTPEQGREILAKQRLNRPVSPHLSIYKLEQSWFGASAWTRITGCTLSGVLYTYMAAYLVAPVVGLHLESASIVTAFSSMPLLLKGGIKFGLGFPFVYHCINGVKHLMYDLGKGFSKPAIKKTDMFVWTTSIIGGLFLAFFV